MLTLNQLATNYQIDVNKDHFPLNTVRLLYIALLETLSENPQSTTKIMLEAIPIVRSILKKRSALKLGEKISTLNQEWLAIQMELAALNSLLPNSIGLTPTLQQLFSFSLPIQESLLFSLVSRSQNQSRLFCGEDIETTLTARSMDSVIYSEIVCLLINKPEHNLSIHRLVNLVYQINDLLDSIIFADEDTQAQNFSAFEIIRQVVPNSTVARQLITKLLGDLQAGLAVIELPTATMALVTEYLTHLTGVLGDIRETPEPIPAPASQT